MATAKKPSTSAAKPTPAKTQSYQEYLAQLKADRAAAEETAGE